MCVTVHKYKHIKEQTGFPYIKGLIKIAFYLSVDYVFVLNCSKNTCISGDGSPHCCSSDEAKAVVDAVRPFSFSLTTLPHPPPPHNISLF